MPLLPLLLAWSMLHGLLLSTGVEGRPTASLPGATIQARPSPRPADAPAPPVGEFREVGAWTEADEETDGPEEDRATQTGPTAHRGTLRALRPSAPSSLSGRAAPACAVDPACGLLRVLRC